MADTITGIIENIFYSKVNFAAISLNTGKSSIRAAGKIRAAVIGLAVELTGIWIKDPTYGRQFQVSYAKQVPIRGREAITSYLTSKFIKGIGPALATKIYDHFGEESLLIIENNYSRLTEVSGITEAKAQEIHKTHKKNRIYMELTALLKPDITEHQITTIYEKYGDRSVGVLKDNPYRLIRELFGIGFAKADKLAKAVGIEGKDPRRIRACIHHVLQQVADTGGHCFMYAEAIEEYVRTFIGDMDMNAVADEILESDEEGSLVIDEDNAIYLRSLYYAERQSAEHVNRLLYSTPSFDVPLPFILQAIKEIELETGFQLDTLQQRAVKYAFQYGLFVLTGEPGTGKTTIIKVLLRAWELAHLKDPACKKSVCLMSFTGRAAMRMSEVTGYPAYTIHRGLGYKHDGSRMVYTYNNENKHPARLIIIDESSMINIFMFRTLIQAIADGSRIIFIGDIDQLPPIGPGNPFRDLVLSIRVPSERLKASYRTSGTIALNASRINRGLGRHAWLEDGTFLFIQAEKKEMQRVAIEEYLKLVEEFGVKNVAFLTPKAESGSVSAKTINALVQDRLNPREPGKPFIKAGATELRLGDRVMQTTNDYINNVFNGEVGFVYDIPEDDSSLTVQFDNGVKITFPGKGLSHLILAYACSIHKSQGSEYEAGIMVFGQEHVYMSYRNLIYTGVSRVKKKMRIVGDRSAINTAIGEVGEINRQTKLKHLIAVNF